MSFDCQSGSILISASKSNKQKSKVDFLTSFFCNHIIFSTCIHNFIAFEEKPNVLIFLHFSFRQKNDFISKEIPKYVVSALKVEYSFNCTLFVVYTSHVKKTSICQFLYTFHTFLKRPIKISPRQNKQHPYFTKNEKFLLRFTIRILW